jgi:integrase
VQNNTPTKLETHLRQAKIQLDGSLSLHTLRKCCIANWANEINNPEVVRTLAGHSDLKTTMEYYSDVNEEQRRKAAKAIDKLISAGKKCVLGTYDGR